MTDHPDSVPVAAEPGAAPSPEGRSTREYSTARVAGLTLGSLAVARSASSAAVTARTEAREP